MRLGKWKLVNLSVPTCYLYSPLVSKPPNLWVSTVPSLTLIWVGRGGNFTPPSPSWFSLNNSRTVKAVNPGLCSVQQHSIRDIRAKFGIHNSPEFPDIGQNSDVGISDFRISCHNSRSRNDIDMKLRPVTKLDKRNKITSKKFDVDVMSENCDVIVIFRISGQFGAVRRPDSGHRFCKNYVFRNSNHSSYKNWKKK